MTTKLKTSGIPPRLLVFASGTATGGGTGFEKMVENSRSGVLTADIVGVVSNHKDGGVKKHADKLGIPFVFMPGPYTGEEYLKIVEEFHADYVALSGWLKFVVMELRDPANDNHVLQQGLLPNRTVNIHPGPIPRFGGPGMYGDRVHLAVLKAYKEGTVSETGPSMHFVTREFDRGPCIFYKGFLIDQHDNLDSLRQKVSAIEHQYQSYVMNLVVTRQIEWDGRSTLKFPVNYPFRAESSE